MMSPVTRINTPSANACLNAAYARAPGLVGARTRRHGASSDRRPALLYDDKACPEGYTKGIAALRPSSRENPLRLDQPEGNWMYVCIPTRPWTERVVGFFR